MEEQFVMCVVCTVRFVFVCGSLEGATRSTIKLIQRFC